jgi:hypothetical protein
MTAAASRDQGLMLAATPPRHLQGFPTKPPTVPAIDARHRHKA